MSHRVTVFVNYCSSARFAQRLAPILCICRLYVGDLTIGDTGNSMMRIVKGLLDHLELADIKSDQSMADITYCRPIWPQPLSSARLFSLPMTFNFEGPF